MRSRLPVRTLLLAGILSAAALGGAASADTGAPATDTQTSGGLIVRTETSTSVEGGVQVRTVRIFNNDRLVRETRTTLGAVAGFEATPRAWIIVIDERTEPPTAEVAQPAAPARAAAPAPRLALLPSTSTIP